MRRILLLLLLSSLTGCAQPQPRTVTQGSRVYLPVTPVQGYVWPARGFGHPPEAWDISHEELIGEQPVWFYDWWWDCSRWTLDGGVYIPSVARAWYPQVLACNDGRPLLVLNEPEDANQASLTPAQAAAVLHEAVTTWSGEVWCCGIQVQHLPYTIRLVDAYQANYGEWPADGWHVHVYSQRNGNTYNATFLADVYEGLAALDTFVVWATERGILGRGIVVSEYGTLADEQPDLLPVLEAFDAELTIRSTVLSAAWFSVNYPPWASSDLLSGDGTLTELGEAWTRCGAAC